MSSTILQNKWNKFVREAPAGSFLQSWEWGEFQRSVGRKAWYLVVHGKKKLHFSVLPGSASLRHIPKDPWLLAALVIKHELPLRKCYLYSPRGPLLNFFDFGAQKPIELFQYFLNGLETLAKHERAIFFRVDPEWLESAQMHEFVLKIGFKKASHEVQPKDTSILDLQKSEAELLRGMHEKTRYNIRLAEKRGARVESRVSPAPYRACSGAGNLESRIFEKFWHLVQETAKRDKFRAHPKEYYKKMLGITLGGSDPPRGVRPPSDSVRLSIELFTASYQNSTIAAAIAAFFGRRATYLHGASSNEYRNVMAPYLLHWEIIKEAKRRGCTEYDLWGISEKKWPGVTRFKKGFGGAEANYIGAYDFVFNKPWHALYRVTHRAKQIVGT